MSVYKSTFLGPLQFGSDLSHLTSFSINPFCAIFPFSRFPFLLLHCHILCASLLVYEYSICERFLNTSISYMQQINVFSSFLFIFFLRFNDSPFYANTLQAGRRLYAGYLHVVHTYSSICQLHFWANINATITIYCGQHAPRKIRVNMRGKCKLQSAANADAYADFEILFESN